MNTPNITHPALQILLDNVNIHKAIAGKDKTVYRYNDEPLDMAKESKKIFDEIIRNLEIEIDASIQNKVKALHGKYILIVGKIIRLLEAVGSYVYCMSGHTALNFYSFSGKDDKGIEYILNSSVYYDGNDKLRTGNLMDCLASCGTVFLGNLKCHDRLLLERLASETEDIKKQYHQNNKGMLIVSTLTPLADIPEYFKSLFEVIELEPGKQSRVNGIKKPNRLFYRWNDTDRIVLYSKDDKTVEFTEQEAKLFLYLKEDRKTQDEIIGYIWEVHKSFDIKKKKPNLGEIRGRINTKCRKIVATDLISELTDGYYSLKVGVEEQ